MMIHSAATDTFDALNIVTPKPIPAKVQGDKAALGLKPKSVTVISLEQ